MNSTERMRRWREAHPEHKERDREYKRANKERLAERDRRYYEANKEKLRADREANRDRKREYDRSHRENNKALIAEKDREYYARNRDRVRETQARWCAANLEARRVLHARRRARKRGHFIEDIDRLVVLERDDGACGICGEDVDPTDFHVDHFVPLSRGGEHSYANAQTAHPACNLSKGAALPA